METPFVFRLESYTPQSNLVPEDGNGFGGFGGFDRRLIVVHFNNMIKELLHDMLYCSEHLTRLKPKDDNVERIERHLHVIGLGNIERMSPVTGFPHLSRYRWTAPGTITYPEFRELQNRDDSLDDSFGVQDNYSGFVLLANYGYPTAGQFTFLVIAENMAFPFLWTAKEFPNRFLGVNVLAQWLSGAFAHQRSTQSNGFIHGRFEYLKAIHHWLRNRTLRSVLKPTQFIEPIEHIAQWENLLYILPENMTETQTALLPDMEDTKDHAKWLIFADAIEEISPNNPNLEIIRFFHTDTRHRKVKSNLDLLLDEVYSKKKE